MAFNQSYRRILNKLDYYNYQQGFIVRRLNQETGWNSHIEKCHSFILKALDLFKPQKVTVLGSGWLLELPLNEMLEKVKNICLVDIIHPPEIMKDISNLPGVEFISEDITGGLIDEIWLKTPGFQLTKKRSSLENITIPEYKFSFDPGMVISLNIITQLEILPLRYLTSKLKVEQDDLNRFRREIQDKHLSLLKKNKSVLISDVAEIFTEKSGNVTEKQSFVSDIPEGRYNEEWTWDFDLKGSDYVRKRSVFRVKAIIM